MNLIREIVTKAVVAKGKKKIKLSNSLTPENSVYSVLGCWIINHEYSTSKEGDFVKINGEFEVDVWYSLDNNSKTEVTRKQISYEDKIKVKQVVNDYIDDSEQIEIRVLQHPHVDKAKITMEDVDMDITIELQADVIGETKIQITILQDNTTMDEEDFENLIDENFIKST